MHRKRFARKLEGNGVSSKLIETPTNDVMRDCPFGAGLAQTWLARQRLFRIVPVLAPTSMDKHHVTGFNLNALRTKRGIQIGRLYRMSDRQKIYAMMSRHVDQHPPSNDRRHPLSTQPPCAKSINDIKVADAVVDQKLSVLLHLANVV